MAVRVLYVAVMMSWCRITESERVGAADDFEAVFVTEAGVEQRVPWWRLPDVVDELGRAVRSSPSFRGRRGFPGWYWASTSGGLVGFESWVQRDHLVALDFDASVVGIVSQPFWLCWTAAGGKRRRHAPDFLVRWAGGAVMVLDSRPAQLIGERDREAFAVTGGLAPRWAGVMRCGIGSMGCWSANQRWLAGYRHPRCFDEHIAARLLEVFNRPRALMDGAELVGDPLGVLPVLYHLLWRRWLVADLSVVLSHRTVVRVSPKVANLSEDVANLSRDLPPRVERVRLFERPGVLSVGDQAVFGGTVHTVVAISGAKIRLLSEAGEASVVALPFLLSAPRLYRHRHGPHTSGTAGLAARNRGSGGDFLRFPMAPSDRRRQLLPPQKVLPARRAPSWPAFRVGHRRPGLRGPARVLGRSTPGPSPQHLPRRLAPNNPSRANTR